MDDSSLPDMNFDVAAGQQYESTLSPLLYPSLDQSPDATPSISEKTVRPFESYRERRDQRLAQLRTIEPEAPIAQACWGGVRDNSLANATAEIITPGFRTQSRDPQDEQEEDPASEVWQEVSYEAREIEVASDEDPEVTITIKTRTSSLVEIPAMNVSKVVSGGGFSTREEVTTITIPERVVRIMWQDITPQR